MPIRPLLFGLIVAVSAQLAFIVGPAFSQQATAPAPVKDAEVERLITNLEDDAARARLIADLRILLAVEQGEAATDDRGAEFIGSISGGLAEFGDQLDRTFAGLAIGFGAQTLVKDFITGIFILFEDSIHVGDVATVGGNTGVIEAITVRTVRLRDLSGTVHTVPFSSVDLIANLTKDFSYALRDVGIGYREDVDYVIGVLREIGAELAADPEFGAHIIGELEVLGLNEFADSAVIVRIRLKTRPITQWGIKREFNRRIKRRFDALGIEIPFPHQTIYFGADRAGKAPPTFVQMQPAAADTPAPETAKPAVASAPAAPPTELPAKGAPAKVAPVKIAPDVGHDDVG